MEAKQCSTKRLTVVPSSYKYFIVTNESPELIDNDSIFLYTLVRIIVRIQPTMTDLTRAITEH